MDNDRGHISEKILDYLRKNPDAGDTLEGITNWWLEIERVESSVGEVADALEDLVQRGIVRIRKNNGITIYGISEENVKGHNDINAAR